MAGKPWCNACGAFTVCRHDGVQRGTTARKPDVHYQPPGAPGKKKGIRMHKGGVVKKMTPGRVAERELTRQVVDEGRRVVRTPDGRDLVINPAKPRGQRIVGDLGRGGRVNKARGRKP